MRDPTRDGTASKAAAGQGPGAVGGRVDTIVVGGGIMGATVAFRLAEAGQSVVLLERGGLCTQASGVNAGTLSVQIKRAALIPYAMRGWELWRTAAAWLGVDVHFAQVGGVTAAFAPDEAEMLTERMAARVAAGAPVEMVGPNRARELEPGLTDRTLLAAWCPLDGYASSYLLGDAFREALGRAGVRVHEHTAVEAIEREDTGYAARTASGTVRARRVVVAGGVWMGRILARDFGVHIPIACRVNMVSVTERMPPVVSRVLGISTGLLTLKQAENGTVLVGGGWQGRGNPDDGGYEVIPENLIGNLRLAAFVIPALREARVVRTWLGLEASAEDALPLVGEIPGAPDAFVIGCVRGGYTIGPCMGTLLAQRILGREPDLPLFDPARAVRVPDEAAQAPTILQQGR